MFCWLCFWIFMDFKPTRSRRFKLCTLVQGYPRQRRFTEIIRTLILHSSFSSTVSLIFFFEFYFVYKRLFFAVSLYPLSFFANTPFKSHQLWVTLYFIWFKNKTKFSQFLGNDMITIKLQKNNYLGLLRKINSISFSRLEYNWY